MKVYGYTEDKDVVQVDLSIDEIVSAGIDPWRLDLFDPDPVTVRASQTELNFMRLKDVSFTYRTDDSGVVLAMHDGVQPVAVCSRKHSLQHWADTDGDGTYGIVLPRVQQSELPFAEHLRNYLRCLPGFEPVLRYDREAIDGLPATDVFCHPAWKEGRPFVSLPKPHAAVTFLADAVRFDMRDLSTTPWLPRFCYIGEMFREMQVAVELPERVNWALAKHRPHKPFVFGPALRNALLGNIVAAVDFALGAPPNSWDLIADYQDVLCEPDASSSEFRFIMNECLYRLSAGYPSFSMSDQLRSRDGNFYSADGVYSLVKDEVRGSRIALFDIARRQFRILSTDLEQTGPLHGVLKEMLIADGFKYCAPE